jgi:hypothetical protein
MPLSSNRSRRKATHFASQPRSGERRLQRASLVLETALAVALNPANLMRARLSRRQNGRFGESFAAKDHAVEALMSQVRNLRLDRRPAPPPQLGTAGANRRAERGSGDHAGVAPRACQRSEAKWSMRDKTMFSAMRRVPKQPELLLGWTAGLRVGTKRPTARALQEAERPA